MRSSGLKQGCAVILTAHEVEYSAIRAHLSSMKEKVYRGTIYEHGIFADERGWWEIGIAQIGVGNASAAFEAERAITCFQPDVVLFVGVAGGVKDVAIGDVVVGTKIYNYTSGKDGKTGFQIRPDLGESSFSLLQRAKVEGRGLDWHKRIQEDHGASRPRVFVGPIAAGEQVFASMHSLLFAFLQKNYGDTLAVEMEGRGFLKAIHANEGVRGLVIRGISDLLENKDPADAPHATALAMRHASAFAFQVLAKLDDRPATSTDQPPEDTHLIHVHIHEKHPGPTLGIILQNTGTKNALPVEVKIDILDTGKFFFCQENDPDGTRFVLEPTSYDIELSPDLQGQSETVPIAHLLRPDEPEHIELRLQQFISDAHLAYVWYYLKVTICYIDKEYVEAEPLLLSIPPVNLQKGNVWEASDTPCAVQNRNMLWRMAALPAKRSASVERAVRNIPMHYDYEKGLDQLKEYAKDKNWRYEFETYESRLRENLQSERLYGTSEQVRSDRARITEQLNRLVQEQLGRSFNDLCLTASPSSQMVSPIADYAQKIDTSSRRKGVFVCYSRRDERYLNELRTHLAHYTRTGVLKYWDDTKISPGTKWYAEIQSALQNARVAILLISADFFDSDFILQQELPVLLDAARQQKTTIFCVVVRPCLFKETELAQFQAINAPSTPLSTMSYAKREKVWVKVAELVRETLQERD